MKVQKFIEVRLLKKRTIPVTDVVQYDTGVQLVFSLVDFDIPDGTTATLYVQKRSGKFVYQEEDITISGNQITINLENQALTEHGETKYQIMLTNGEDTITTFAGVLRIEKSLADSGATESTTVIRAFDEAVADHVAEFQTKAEQIAAACIATIPDDYTTMESKVNELANAVKGNLSGAVVLADDVSSVEHNPAVWVHGKNLISYPHNHTTKTENGLTFTDNGDGSVTVIGTATVTTYYDLCKFTSRFFSGGQRYFNAMNNKVTFEGYTIQDCSVQQTQSGNSFCHLVFTTGQTIDKTYYPQVEIGTAATDYEPYIDPSTVKVRRCGKNLIPYPFKETTVTKKGVTFTDNKDGTITVNGTAEATVSFIFFEGNMPVDGAYTLSGLSGGSGSTYYVQPLCSDKAHPGLADASKSYKWDGLALNRLQLNVVVGTVVSNLRVSVMLEKSNAATAFEPYIGAEYIPSSDGTVSGLTSVSPNMTILTDTEGAIVECEYNRDTNKVIEKLTNAIIALGGTV